MITVVANFYVIRDTQGAGNAITDTYVNPPEPCVNP